MKLPPYRQYIVDYFRQIYAVPAEITFGDLESDALIKIPDLAGNFFEDEALLSKDDIRWKTWQKQSLPILFAGDTPPWYMPQDQSVILSDDLLASAFYWLSGWQEVQFFKQYHALRYPYDQSLQKALNITRLPVVNYYFEIIREAINSLNSQICSPPLWHNSPLAICLTHDIDRLYTGWHQDAHSEWRQKRYKNAAGIILRRLSGQSAAFNLRDIVEMESAFGACSSFYFIPQKGNIILKRGKNQPRLRQHASPPDQPGDFFTRDFFISQLWNEERLENADYDVHSQEILTEMQALKDSGSEIGFHGHFGASIDQKRLTNAVQEFPVPPLGGRFHYLHFDPLRTFRYLQDAGLKYDSTLGFAEMPGFRHGTAFPFYPFDFQKQAALPVLEIPLIAMDTTYRGYLGQETEEAKKDLFRLLDETRKFGGCITVLWHNNYFTPYKFAGWSELYHELLQEGKSRGAWMTSGERIYQFWTERLSNMP